MYIYIYLYVLHTYICIQPWKATEKPHLRPSTTRGWSGGISRTFGAVSPAVKDMAGDGDGWIHEIKENYGDNESTYWW